MNTLPCQSDNKIYLANKDSPIINSIALRTYLSEEDADDGAEEDSDGEVHDVSELRRDEPHQGNSEGYSEQPLIHAQGPSHNLDGAAPGKATGVRNEKKSISYFVVCFEV